jgi:hypothetical protein
VNVFILSGVFVVGWGLLCTELTALESSDAPFLVDGRSEATLFFINFC